MQRILNYFNPIRRLGRRKYSYRFPIVFSVLVIILSEIFALHIAKNPLIVGAYIIWVNVATIMYFAFRDGLRGGFIAAFFPILYYFYIIYSRHYTGRQFSSGIDTTIVLAILYFVMAGIIGWLKQTIDGLIESEANERLRLQAVIDQLPVGILLADKNGGILTGNKHMEKLLGRNSAKSLILDDKYVSKVAFRADRALTAKEYPIVQAFRGTTVKAEEIEYVRSDKKRLFLRVNAAPIMNKKGEILAAVSTFYDITHEKELEKRKDDFVNMASHELKTPITSMKLYVDSLGVRVKQYKDERVNKTINSIKTQTDRLQELVNDLLDVSKIQTGKLSFSKEYFRIDELVAETVDDVRGMAKQELVIVSNAPIKVYADRFRIYQVLTNLITNAMKYSPNGKEIKIKVKREGKNVIVSVRDFGIGIAKEQQKKVFERLYQVIDDKEKTYPGFGMGLYISKEIVRRHNGTIWVESEGKGEDVPASKKGSTFYFTLPLTEKGN